MANAKSERSTTYSVVVKNPNSWNAATGEREITAHCGHNHKTLEAAEYCMATLTRWYCQHGRITGTPCARCLGRANGNSTSARWYHAEIKTNYTEAQLAKMAADARAERAAEEEWCAAQLEKEQAELRAYYESLDADK